jgi:alpha-L-rhamnosidase
MAHMPMGLARRRAMQLLLTIDMGVVPSEYQAAVTQDLVDSILNNGSHLSVGEIALPSLFRALKARGENNIIY